MQFFLDTANVEAIKKFARMKLISGVTTNPALIAMEDRNFEDVVREICGIVDGPISAEVISMDFERMVKEARMVANIHQNIVVKIPAIPAGFEAVSVVSNEGIKTNVTILYTANQALIAAKAGATYVSPFIGRLDVNSTSGINLIKEIKTIYDNYGMKTKILAASMRNAIYVKEAALAGADVATIPPEVLDQMMASELTESGLNGFLKQWDKLPKDKRDYFESS